METTVKSYKRVNPSELKQKVKSMYRKVALFPKARYHFEMGRSLAERLGYPAASLDQIPADAIESFAGVGYHFDMAGLKKGNSVLDLGSGSGLDVFFASQQVGETGRVVGIDMTEDQLIKAQNLKNSFGFDNVLFQEGYIEYLPIASESMDVVISNGVINLSSNKDRVFEEAARVLKQGGRLAISDIVSIKQLPQSITCDASLWAACIGGAQQIDQYYKLIEQAGLKVLLVKKNPYKFISDGAKGATENYGIMSLSLVAIK